MKKLVRKDNLIRKKTLLHEKKRFILKNISKSFCFPINFRNKAKLKLHKNFQNNSFSQQSNRCIITGRKKRINSLYSFSRLIFLRFARQGFLSGIRKSSR